MFQEQYLYAILNPDLVQLFQMLSAEFYYNLQKYLDILIFRNKEQNK